MKPILLKIQGINSFLDEQVIDFEALLKYGLFGIFGKTGSGKTTILDAITLALYGQIPRYSSNEKKEFINSKSATAYVYFEFQIESINYTVERSYKLKNDGFIETTNTRFFKKINDEIEILGDKVNETNNEIENLIGLSYKDFTRIVVLPQGKFSDFLLLVNSDRNAMLERVFGLEEYGKYFVLKVNKLKSNEDAELNSIEKQLETYNGVSRKKIKEVKLSLSETESTINNLKEVISNSNKKLALEKEFEKNFINLDLYLEKKNTLDSKKNEIQEKEILFTKSKNAKIVYPIIENIILIEKDLNNTKNNFNIEEEELSNKKLLLITLKENYEAAKNNKKENEPLCIEKIHKLKDAISYEEKLILATSQKNSLADKEKDFENKLINEREQLKIFQENIDNHNISLSEINKRKKEIQISSSFRTSIDLGFKTLEKIKENNKILNSKKDNVQIKNNTLELNNENINNLSKELEEIITKLNFLKSDFSSLNENQISSDELLLLNNEILESKRIFNEKNKEQDLLFSFQKELQEKEILLQTTKKSLNLLNEKSNKTKEELNILNKKISIEEKENLVNIIIKDLHNGDECPICGSEIKNLKTTDKSQSLKDFELEKLDLESKIKDFDLETSKYKVQFDLTSKEIEFNKIKISEYSQKINTYSFETEENIIKNISILFENKTTKKNEIENKIKILNDTIKTFETNKNIQEINIATLKEKISNDKVFIFENEKEISDLENKIKNFENEVLEISKENNIIDNNDYFTWNRKIKEFDKENEVLNIDLDKVTNLIDVQKSNLDKTKETIISLEKNISNIKIEIGETLKNILQYTEKIKSLSNSENLKTELLNTENFLNTLREEEKNLEEDFNKTQIDLQNLKTKNIETKSNLENLEENLIKSQNNLDKNLKEYNFENSNIVKNFLLSELEEENISVELKSYTRDFSIVTEHIDNLKKSTENQNRNDTVKSIMENENILFESNNNLEENTKSFGELSANLKSLEENIIKVDSLLDAKSKVIYQLDLLTELSSLLKGNEFIKFITKKQLEYITFEASKRFRQMTKNRYAFELDDTDFIIRDDYNNGVRRSPKTLSGGETFIASLCLALALSSKIQLNSKNHLEFFFLDEGFGTLDSSSLDQVISSLEDLQKEKINIGIISHSKNVKERIPIRLIVDSPDDFENGSTVRFEIN